MNKAIWVLVALAIIVGLGVSCGSFVKIGASAHGRALGEGIAQSQRPEAECAVNSDCTDTDSVNVAVQTNILAAGNEQNQETNVKSPSIGNSGGEQGSQGVQQPGDFLSKLYHNETFWTVFFVIVILFLFVLYIRS